MQEEIIEKYSRIKQDTVKHIKVLLEEINLSKNKELEAEIELLKKELKEVKKLKKYGLVWEEKQEFFDKQTIGKLPVLKEVTENDVINNDGVSNILIEGDNYHTLSVLNYTHKGKIDVIYIDPPYNTGNKSWKYNNDYVDKEDNFKHSKWLSFINKRLILAKKLLKENGSLIFAIDHNEVHTSGLLLQEIFPDKEITCITVIHNPSGIQGKNFSHNNEYVFFVYPNGIKKSINFEERDDENADVRTFMNSAKGKTNNYLRETGYNCFYPVLIKDGEIIGFGDVSDKDYHPNSSNIKKENGIIEIYPIDSEGVERKWTLSRNSVEKSLSELNLKYNKNKKVYEIIRIKKYINYKTVWIDKKYNAKKYGTELLKDILHIDFPFPKSLNLVKECLKAIIHNKNGIILDFFAGSGTTGHAVLELNKEDGGNRKFILATNNENNICKEVTYERVKRVMNGYKNSKGENIEGLGGNLKYLKTDFIDKHKSNDDLRERMVNRCTELLCLKENIWEEIKQKNVKIKIFKRNDKYLAVLYDMFYFDEFKKVLKGLDKDVSIYAFSHYRLLKEDFEDIGIPFEIEDIPDPILEVYDTIFGL